MSWSISATLDQEHTEAGLQRMLNDLNILVPTGNEHCIEERDEQVQAARNAVLGLIADSGVFSNAEKITVLMSGHANTEHKADPPWANDFITLTVAINRYQPDVKTDEGETQANATS